MSYRITAEFGEYGWPLHSTARALLTWQCQHKGTCFLQLFMAGSVMNNESINTYEMTQDYPS